MKKYLLMASLAALCAQPVLAREMSSCPCPIPVQPVKVYENPQACPVITPCNPCNPCNPCPTGAAVPVITPTCDPCGVAPPCDPCQTGAATPVVVPCDPCVQKPLCCPEKKGFWQRFFSF